MEIDGSQNEGLRIDCDPGYIGNADETTISGVDTNNQHLPVEPSSAGGFGLGVGRRSGNIIAMGR